MTEIEFQRDTNLTDIQYRSWGQHHGEKLPPKSKHLWSERGDGLSGRWKLSPHDVVRIKYQPFGDPDCRDFSDIIAKRKQLEEVKEYQRNQREIARLSAMLGSLHEQGYAESMEEARMLVSALERGSGDLPPYDELLTSAGFELEPRMHRFMTRPAEYDSWKRAMKGGGTFTLIIRDTDLPDAPHGEIWCNYSGNSPRWHNVFQLDADRRGERDPEYRVYFFWPPAAQDLRAVAAAHLIAVIEKRLARERTRISTPLGGSTRRLY